MKTKNLKSLKIASLAIIVTLAGTLPSVSMAHDYDRSYGQVWINLLPLFDDTQRHEYRHEHRHHNQVRYLPVRSKYKHEHQYYYQPERVVRSHEGYSDNRRSHEGYSDNRITYKRLK
jgi:hypothetical protein